MAEQKKMTRLKSRDKALIKVALAALIAVLGYTSGNSLSDKTDKLKKENQELQSVVTKLEDAERNKEQLEENLIYPRVVGKAISLPAIWVLAAITVGGSLMGILGMLIGVPVAAAVYRLLRENMEKRECDEA